MGYLKNALVGLLLAAVLFAVFFVITMAAINFTRPGGSEGEDVLIAFLMGIAYARALSWFLQRGRRRVGQ